MSCYGYVAWILQTGGSAATSAYNMERMVHCLGAGPSNSTSPASAQSGAIPEYGSEWQVRQSDGPSRVNAANRKRREPRQGIQVIPGALPLLVLRGLVARLSHLPKSETECDVTPPGDAKPRKSVDDDRAEKWAAIGS
jgi:hypothetical protein